MSEKSDQKQGSRFKPGTSGNPKGKPPGTRNAALMALDKIGEDNAKDILQAAVTAAKAGDMRAADTILSRIWPARKSRPVALQLPPVTDAAGVTAAMAEVVAAMARGGLAPDEAHAVSAVLEAQRRTIETGELEQRIAALESKGSNHDRQP